MKLKQISASDIIRDNMMEYGSYVILQRALPRFEDGLKPVHRRILFTLHLEKATKLVKSANISGSVMKIHPHGDTYDTIVNMVQKDRQHLNLIEGKGNFGQAVSRDLTAAAARYTEIKMSPVTVEIMKDLDKNLVDFIPSYDGKVLIPDVLPVKFPLVLTQASSGVAYGMASSIPSFNLIELVKAMIKYINEGKRTLLVPDFATGGRIVNDKETFKKINLEGSGSVNIRGKAEISGNSITFTDVPFTTTREAIVDKIVELSKTKLKEVTGVKDLTDFKGPKVRITFKRGTDMNLALEKLYQFTPLQSAYSTNLNVLINGSPKKLSVWSLIDEWIQWRKGVIVRGINFEIGKKEKELHYLRGLEKVLLDIDEAIKIIRFSKEEEIESSLMKKFSIDEGQAQSVGNMRLRNINKDYIIKRIKNIDALEQEIKDLGETKDNDQKLNEIVIQGLQESSDNYGVKRTSEIIEVNSEKIKEVKQKLEEVPNYATRLFLTKDGYVKKFEGYSAAGEEQYLKPGDDIVETFDVMNTDEVLVFSNSEKACFKIKVSDIEISTNKSLGTYIPSITGDKDITGYSVLSKNYKFVIIGYDNNKISKVLVKQFEGRRKKLVNSISKKANAVSILTFKDEGEFLFKTTQSKFKCPTTSFEFTNRYGQGVYGPRKGTLTELKRVKK